MGKMRHVVLALLFATAVLMPGPTRAATSLTFAPSADAYVRSDRATTNYGSSTSIEADNSPIERTLFRFDVSGVGTGTVTSAKLRLFNTNDSSVGGNFFRLDEAVSWTEAGVKWSNAPATVGTAVASIGTVSANRWYEVELSAIINRDGTFFVGMNSTNSNGVGYASKEASAANRPQLVVTFDAPLADPTVPTVAITSPTAGSTVAGLRAVEASASDDVGVARVEFFVDGAPASTDTAAPFAFDWDTRTVVDGNHTLSATAYDGDEKSGSSPGVTVRVANAPPPPTPPVPLTFFPSADAYVKSDRATTNYGSAATIEADNSPVERTLFRFEVSGVGTGRVTSAKLRLFNTNESSVGGSFFRLNETVSWTEGGVRWDNAPGTVGTAVASLGTVTQSRWYEVELAAIINRDGTFFVGMNSTNSNGVGYASKEASAANRPQLVVTFEAALADPTVPTVAITSPTAGSTVAGLRAVEASASDDVGVARVEFSVDGAPASTDTAAPFAFDWDTTAVADGNHALGATAYDGDGKSGSAPPVTVRVTNNPADTTPPTPPANLTATAISETRVDLAWTGSTDNVGVTGYGVFRDGSQTASTGATSYTDTTVLPGRTYQYRIRALDAAGNFADSSTAGVTTPGVVQQISFGAAGDFGANSSTAGSLNRLDSSGVNFFMAVGDLDYGEVSSPQAWCDYIKSRLPTLGPNFPFELVAGNHEDSNIEEHAACLPDRLGSTIGPNSIYGGEYYFDYPASNPLVRVVMISPRLSIQGSSYDYQQGDAHYNFVANALDNAHARNIPWKVVGFHMTSPGTDLTNLLVQKRVDLVIHGHQHSYGRGAQLTTCPDGSTYDCVSDDGSDGVYPKHGGTLTVLNGSFGQGSPNGFTKFTVTPDRIDAVFLRSSGTGDSYSIR